MTFELSADLQALRDRARSVAQDIVAPQAAAIDRTGDIAAAVAVAAQSLLGIPIDPLSLVVVIEELAVMSGAVALTSLSAQGAVRGHTLAGLRGARLPEDGTAAQLGLAATTLGLGRAAMAVAISAAKAAPAVGAGEQPLWVLADAATELEAARLMVYRAAQTAPGSDGAESNNAAARLMTTVATRHAIDAALRICGPDAYQQGSVLERLARDARAAALLLGTEEHLRITAGRGLLPA